MKKTIKKGYFEILNALKRKRLDAIKNRDWDSVQEIKKSIKKHHRLKPRFQKRCNGSE